MENQTGHIDQIKQLNTGIVYRIIDQYGPISRITLSKQSQLAPASITKITRELIDAHLITEIEFPVLGLRGRPAVGLVIKSQGWQFLSILIGKGSVCLSLKEINTQTIIEENFTFSVKGNELFSSTLANLIQHFFSTYADYLERVTAISILTDGIIDAYSGVIHKQAYFEINNLPLCHYLTNQTGLPTYLQTNTHALALTEYFSLKNKKTPKNIIYLQIDDVVNAAIINHGISLDSNTHKAIHFGHIQIQKGGELCYCGGSGCLEKEISIAAILVKAAELLRNNYPDSYLSVNEIKIENICAGVHLGDPLCLYLFNHIAELLAKPLSTMINIFGTELVLINSPLNQAENIFFSLLHQYCSEQVMPLYTNNLQIKKSELSKKQSETALIQQALYDGSLLIQLLQG